MKAGSVALTEGSLLTASNALTIAAASDVTLGGGARTASGDASMLNTAGRLAVDHGSMQAQGLLTSNAGDVTTETRGAISGASVALATARNIDNRGEIFGGAIDGTTRLTTGRRLNSAGLCRRMAAWRSARRRSRTPARARRRGIKEVWQAITKFDYLEKLRPSYPVQIKSF